MTVIAWDGKTLAADKRTNYGTTIGTSTKIERMPDGALVGCAGNASQIAEMRQWFRDGRVAERFPASQRVEADRCDVLCIEPDGRIHVYQLTPYPTLIEDRTFSFGSGSNYALAAMHLGFDARKAVEVASALDGSCGNGVDTLTLHPEALRPPLTGEQIDEILDSGLPVEEGLTRILEDRPLSEGAARP